MIDLREALGLSGLPTGAPRALLGPEARDASPRPCRGGWREAPWGDFHCVDPHGVMPAGVLCRVDSVDACSLVFVALVVPWMSVHLCSAMLGALALGVVREPLEE